MSREHPQKQHELFFEHARQVAREGRLEGALVEEAFKRRQGYSSLTFGEALDACLRRLRIEPLSVTIDDRRMLIGRWCMVLVDEHDVPEGVAGESSLGSFEATRDLF